MKCKTTNNVTVYWWAALVIGFVVAVLGVASQLRYLALAADNDMFNGLLTGMGGGVFTVSVVMLIRSAVMSPKKRRQEEIGMKDERNIAVSRAAMSVAYVAATLLMAALVVAFVWMKLTVPALIVSAVSVLQVLIFLAAYLAINRRY